MRLLRPLWLQHRLPASYYRGGTSRALIFSSAVLPPPSPDSLSHPSWPSIFLGALGSPDPNGRQLDGLGGGISSLSKVCVISPVRPPNRARADVEYTFAAIGVKDAEVDFSSNCGNMVAAVGPWAWDHGLLEPHGRSGEDGMKAVTVLNTNTGKIIRSSFEVRDGEAVVEGNLSISGVSGTGAPIQLDFLNPAGSKTGKLLPTGRARDMVGGVVVSCIDAGNPCVFVRAEELGTRGSILPEDFDKDMKIMARLEVIRRLSGVKMGIAETVEEVPGSIPKICIVSRPETHVLLSGEELEQGNFDLMARAISVGQPHRAVPITVALCLAVAAETSGSVVQESLSDNRADEKSIIIGHPSGRIVVGSNFDEHGEVKYATLFRTARRLFEGTIFWKASDDDPYSKYLKGKNKS